MPQTQSTHASDMNITSLDTDSWWGLGVGFRLGFRFRCISVNVETRGGLGIASLDSDSWWSRRKFRVRGLGFSV
jgi:hypothetical protein